MLSKAVVQQFLRDLTNISLTGPSSHCQSPRGAFKVSGIMKRQPKALKLNAAFLHLRYMSSYGIDALRN